MGLHNPSASTSSDSSDTDSSTSAMGSGGDGSPDISAYLGFVLSFLLLISLYVVFYYAEPGFPKITYCTCVVGYFCAFGVLLTVPIDIATVVMERRSTSTTATQQYTDHMTTLSTLYNFFFTVILIWGNVVLVFEEYYNTDGYFTVVTRVASTIYRVLMDIVVYLVVGLIVLSILIGQKAVPSDSSALKLAAVILTNIVYESFLMFLLGFGLFEFPKEIWVASNIEKSLSIAETKAAFDLKSASDALWAVTNLGGNVILTKAAVNQYGDPSLSKAVDILESETERTSATGTSEVATNKSGQVTIHTLAALRLRLNYAKDQYRMAQARAESTMLHAYNCEDILKAKQEGKLFWSVLNRDATDWEYKWFLVYRPWAFKFFALCAGLLSLFSFVGICCCMKGADVSASIYYEAVHDPSSTAGGIVLFIFISLGYTSYITSWALFQMNFAGLMILVKYSTTPESLSFNVRMIARLAAPLAFFYLGWISESGLRSGPWTQNLAPYHYEMRNATVNATLYDPATMMTRHHMRNVTELTQVTGGVQMMSAFSHFYQLQSIDVIRDSFGTVFPVILIVVLSLTITSIYNRACVLAKMQKYQFGTPLCDEATLAEGKKKLKNQKERILRKAQYQSFASHIQKVWKKDFDDEGADGGGGKGGIGGIFGHRKGKGAPLATAELVVPEDLSGPVEKKGRATIGFGTAWKQLYAEVRDPGVLHFFKDEAACRANYAESTLPMPLKLSLVIQVSLVTVPARDDVEISIDFGDDKLQLRLSSLAEAERWKRLLVEWKEYCILNATQKRSASFAGSGDDTTELATTTSAGAGAGAASKNRSVSVDLADINIEETDASSLSPSSSAPVKKGVFGGMFGRKPEMSREEQAIAKLEAASAGKPSSSSSSSSSSGASRGNSNNNKPKLLEGYVEKKHHIGSMHLSSEWQKMFCRIDESTTSLTYFKASNLNSPAGSIDLKMASSIEGYSKGSKEDAARFNIDMGDGKIYKFRAKSAAEGEQWTTQLKAWREHFLFS